MKEAFGEGERTVQDQSRLALWGDLLIGCGEGIKTGVEFSGSSRLYDGVNSVLGACMVLGAWGPMAWVDGPLAPLRMTRAHCRNEASLLPGNITRAKLPPVTDQMHFFLMSKACSHNSDSRIPKSPPKT